MDVSTVTPAQGAATSTSTCPRCGDAFPALPAVTTPSFGGRALRRCLRCGTRMAHGGAELQAVMTCEGCGLPFLGDPLQQHGAARCDECSAGRVPEELPDEEISAAAENEVRAALSTRWRFVSSPTAQGYLDRIARQVAERVDGAPREVRVVVVADHEHRTLALPSGLLLVTTGLLEFLEDEAELAFVLAHEVAHAASGEAAVRLVRLGFRATARERGASDGLCWSDAAVDLARLGYGNKRERDADARALSAMLALEYEPHSALRYLERLNRAAEAALPAVAETIVAHAAPRDRMRRIERALYGRISGSDAFRVNREVFRRAASREALRSSLVPASLEAPAPPPWGMSAVLDETTDTVRVGAIVWAAIGVITLIALATWLLL